MTKLSNNMQVRWTKTKLRRVAKFGAMSLAMAMLLTPVVSTVAPMEAHAAILEDNTEHKIEKIRIKLTCDEYDDWDDYGFPYITAESTRTGYEVTECYRRVLETKDEDDQYWQDERHTIADEAYVIKLKAAENYKFKKIPKGDVAFRGIDAECTKAVRNDDYTEMEIRFKLLNTNKLVDNIDEDTLKSTGTVVYWGQAQLADHYKIKATKGSQSITIDNIEGRQYDLGPAILSKGFWDVRIYPMSKSGTAGEPVDTSIYITAEDVEYAKEVYGMNEVTAPGQSRFSTGWHGYDGNWTWRNTDGTMPQTQWLMVDGKWYYFGQNKICVQNNWILSKGIWYYLGPTGAMLTSTTTPDGYWVGADGAWNPDVPRYFDMSRMFSQQ